MTDPNLTCHGCAHSAAGSPFPGHPSGERPCGFCSRSPDGLAEYDVWYDGTPAFKTPMDNYIATDRLQQQRIFDQLDRINEGEKVAPRQSYMSHDGANVWCCEGGEGPGGHTWTCWRWLGIAFG